MTEKTPLTGDEIFIVVKNIKVTMDVGMTTVPVGMYALGYFTDKAQAQANADELNGVDVHQKSDQPAYSVKEIPRWWGLSKKTHNKLELVKHRYRHNTDRGGGVSD